MRRYYKSSMWIRKSFWDVLRISTPGITWGKGLVAALLLGIGS